MAQVKSLQGRITPMGLIVDGVEEAVNITAGDIDAAPEFGLTNSAENSLCMAKLKGREVSPLDIDRALEHPRTACTMPTGFSGNAVDAV